ncbi:hypothetical protein D3C85_560690 [compost metagenome]
METQGANGIINRITPKDVAIKHRDRFANIDIIDVKTKDAIHNPDGLLARTLAGSSKVA